MHTHTHTHASSVKQSVNIFNVAFVRITMSSWLEEEGKGPLNVSQ